MGLLSDYDKTCNPKTKIPHDQVLALLKQGFDQYSKPENEFLYLLSEVAQNSPKLLKMGTIQNLLNNLESSKFPKNLLKKFKEKYKLAHESRELNKIYNWNSIEAEKYIENLRPPCHDYANPKCGAKQHPLLTKYPNMPDNYKKELQNCIMSRKNITENSTDIKENNILLVKHFDEKFPITEEQLQAIKCFHCQNNRKCKEKLAFNLDKLRQLHTSNYDNPYTTPIRHLLTSDSIQ